MRTKLLPELKQQIHQIPRRLPAPTPRALRGRSQRPEPFVGPPERCERAGAGGGGGRRPPPSRSQARPVARAVRGAPARAQRRRARSVAPLRSFSPEESSGRLRARLPACRRDRGPSAGVDPSRQSPPRSLRPPDGGTLSLRGLFRSGQAAPSERCARARPRSHVPPPQGGGRETRRPRRRARTESGAGPQRRSAPS